MKVLVVGAKGRMGRATCQAVEGATDLSLVGAVDIDDDVPGSLASLAPEVVVDFTVPTAIAVHLPIYIDAGVHPVVGTTGLSDTDLQATRMRARERRLGGLIAPNFALGAVLMMEFAARAARYLSQIEISEYHHTGKLDAPSGTSLMTRRRIAAALEDPEREIPIHSVRLDGFLASQEVFLGGDGERLTLRHDSIHRRCFMPGVLLAIRRVARLPELVVGLENLLELD